MTLFKKFIIVFTVFFLVMLGIVLSISFRESMDYIEDELFTKAQNTAATLAVSMSQTGGDVTKMSTMADAVFDTGYFSSIVFKDMKGRPLFKKSRDTKMDLPSWFDRLVHLEPATAYAQVSSGWQPLGMLEVTSDATVSKEYLYTLFKKVLIIFAFSMGVGCLLIVIILRSVLKPIEKMEEQAREVLQNRFIRNEDLPDTVELQRMTEAMNRLVDRMAGMHEKLLEQVSKNRQLEYIDPLTGVFNRRYFSVHYHEYTSIQSQRASGNLIAIRLCRCKEANRIVGYDRVNELFKEITKRIANDVVKIQEAFVCRISGTELVIMLPGMDTKGAEALADTYLQWGRVEIDKMEEVKEILYLAFGIVSYDRQRPLEKTMAAIDLALNGATTQNCDAIEKITFENDLPTKKIEWRTMIEEAMRTNSLVAVLKDILMDRQSVMAKLFFDLQTKDSKNIPYPVYAPMLSQLGLFDEYVSYAFAYLSKQGDQLQCHRICMELPVDYLDTTHTFEQMANYVKRLKKGGKEFVVEMGQNDLIGSGYGVVETIAKELHARDIPIGIVRFDGDYKILEMLRTITPLYVKMHAAQLLDMGENLREALGMLLESTGTKLIVVGVHGSDELKDLERLNIDYSVV